MSNLSIAKKARLFEISLVSGYFLINFPLYAPTEIIQTCILYCFLLEGFDKDLHSENIQIQGLNHTICEFKQLSKSVEYSIGRNIFAKHTHNSDTADLEPLHNCNPFDKNVHWRFAIQHLMGPSSGGIIFGLVENDPQCFSKRLKIATSLASSSVKPGDYVDLYLDMNERAMMFIRNGWDFMGSIKLKSTNVGYRFCIQFFDAFGKIELIEYHESNWYMHRLTNTKLKDATFDINRNEAICHAGLALTRPLFELNHFVIALSLFPTVQRWVDGLIFSAICGDRTNYELSYEFALRYQPKGKGGESVGYLAKIFYNQGMYDKAFLLLVLLQPQYVRENKLTDTFAMCLAVVGHMLQNEKEVVKCCNYDLPSENMQIMSIFMIFMTYFLEFFSSYFIK